MKIKSIISCFLCILLLVGCSKSTVKIGKISKLEINNSKVSISEKDILQSKKTIEYFVKNISNDVCKYGAGYSIEYFQNDNWYTIESKEEYNEIMIEYIINPGEEKEFYANWESMYGNLPSGKYRFLKSFSCDNDNEYKYTSSFEFEIK